MIMATDWLWLPVTGASSAGIGAAIARAFAKQNRPLLFLARRLDYRLRELNLPNALCSAVDVTDAETFRKAIEDAENQVWADAQKPYTSTIWVSTQNVRVCVSSLYSLVHVKF